MSLSAQYTNEVNWTFFSFKDNTELKRSCDLFYG